MKTWICRTTPLLPVAALLLIAASTATATQPLSKSLTITTRFGKTYEDCHVLQEDPDGVYIEHSKGMAKLLYADIPAEDRSELGYDAGKAKDYERKRAEKRGQSFEQQRQHNREMMQAQMEMQSRMDSGGNGFSVNNGQGQGFMPFYNSGIPIVSSWFGNNAWNANGNARGSMCWNGFGPQNCVPVWGYANGRFGVTTLVPNGYGANSNVFAVNGTPVHMQRNGQMTSIPLGVPGITNSVPALSNGVPALAPLPQQQQQQRAAAPMARPVTVGRSAVAGHGGGHK